MSNLYEELLNDIQEPTILEEIYPCPNNKNQYLSARLVLVKSYEKDDINFNAFNISTKINITPTLQLGLGNINETTDNIEYVTVKSAKKELAVIPSLTPRGLLISSQMYFCRYANELVKGLSLHENTAEENNKALTTLILRSDNFRTLNFTYSKKYNTFKCIRKNKEPFDFFDLVNIMGEDPEEFCLSNSAKSLQITKYNEPEYLIEDFLSWIGKDYKSLDKEIINARRKNFIKNGLYFKFSEQSLQNMRHFLSFEQRALGATLRDDINTSFIDKNGFNQSINFKKGKILSQDDLILIDSCNTIEELNVEIKNKKVHLVKRSMSNKLDVNLLANIYNYVDALNIVKVSDNIENNFLYQSASNYYTIMYNYIENAERSLRNNIIRNIDDMIEAVYNNMGKNEDTYTFYTYCFRELQSYENIFNTGDKVKRFADDFKNNPDEFKSIGLADNRNSKIAYANQRLFVNPSKEVSVKAKEIQTTQMFYLCSIAAPESDKAGATKHLTVGTFTDKYGTFRNAFVNLKDPTQKIENLSPLDIYNKKVAAEKFNIDEPDTLINALYRGNIIKVPVKDLDYKPQYWVQVSSINIASGICGNFNKARRQLMENNEMSQILPIIGGEPSSLNSGLDIEYVKNYCVRVKDILLQNNKDLTEIPDNFVLTLNNIGIDNSSKILLKNQQKEEYTFNCKILNESSDNNVYDESGNLIISEMKPYQKMKTIKYSILKNYLQAQQNVSMKIIDKPYYKLNDIVFIPDDVKYTEDFNNSLIDNNDEELSHLRLALYKPLKVAYMNFKGYCYEDGMVIREGIAKSLDFASCHTRSKEYVMEKGYSYKLLKPIGSKIYPGDIIASIYDETETLIKNIIVPRDREGILSFCEQKGDTLTITFSGNYNIEIGCKFAGFHGNKCTACSIVPDDLMPLDAETLEPIDMCLNPLGVLTRDNMGQLVEGNLEALGSVKDVFTFEIPEDIIEEAKQANTLTYLIDGETGTPFKTPVNVINCTFVQLDHHSKDKLRMSLLPSAIDNVSHQIKKGEDNQGGCGISELTTNALLENNAYLTLDYLKIISEGAGSFNNSSFARYLIDRAVKGENSEDLSKVQVNRNLKYLVYLYGSLGIMFSKGQVESKIELLTNDAIEQTFINKTFSDEDTDVETNVEIISSTSMSRIDNYIGIGDEKLFKDIVKIDVPDICWINPAVFLTPYLKNIYGIEKKHISMDKLLTGEIKICFLLEFDENGETHKYIKVHQNTDIIDEHEVVYTGAHAILNILYEMTDEDLILTVPKEKINEFNLFKPSEVKKFLLNKFVLLPRSYRRKNKEKFAEADINKAYRYLLNLIHKTVMCVDFNKDDNLSTEELLENLAKSQNENFIKNYNIFYSEYVHYMNVKERKSIDKDFKDLKPYLSLISDKDTGLYRSMILAKRVASSMGSVIVGDPEIKLNEVGIPFLAIVHLYKYDLFNNLFGVGSNLSSKYLKLLKFLMPYKKCIIEVETEDTDNTLYDVKGTSELFNIFENRLKSFVYYNIYYVDSISDRVPDTWEEFIDLRVLLKELLTELLEDKLNILIREPVLHKYNVEGFNPIIVEGYAIHINTLVCDAYNADFDGDNMQNIIIHSEAVTEELNKCITPAACFINDAGEYTYPLIQDVLYGLVIGVGKLNNIDSESQQYEEFNIDDFKNHKYRLKDFIIFNNKKLTAGQWYFLEKISSSFNIYKITLFNILIKNKNNIKNIIRSVEQLVPDNFDKVRLFNSLKLLGFDYIMQEPATISLKDIVEIQDYYKNTQSDLYNSDNNLKYNKILISRHFLSFNNISKEDKISEVLNEYDNSKFNNLLKLLEKETEIFKHNNFLKIVNSGAKGKLVTLHDMIVGGSQPTGIRGNLSACRITNPTINGLSPAEVYSSGYTSLASQYSTNESTKDAGELSRSISTSLGIAHIEKDDCGAKPELHDLYISIVPSSLLSDEFNKYIGKKFDQTTLIKDVVLKTPIDNLTQGDVFKDSTISDKLLPVFEDFRLKSIKAEDIDEPYKFKWKLDELSFSLYVGRVGYPMKDDGTIIKVERVLTEKDIRNYFNNGYFQIYVRTLTDCKVEYGFCSKCFGVTLSSKKLKIEPEQFYAENFQIGKFLATQISQRITQAKMDKKNKSVHEEDTDTIGQFKRLINLSDSPINEPVKLRSNGKLKMSTVNKTHNSIKVNNKTFNVENLIFPHHIKPIKGFLVTNGYENYRTLRDYVNINKYRYLLIEEYYKLYSRNNLTIDPRAFELIVALQTSLGLVLSNPQGRERFKEGTYHNKNTLAKFQDLTVEIVPLSLGEVLCYQYPNTAMGFRDIGLTLSRILTNGTKSNNSNRIEALNGGQCVDLKDVFIPEQVRYNEYKTMLKHSDVSEDEIIPNTKEVIIEEEDIDLTAEFAEDATYGDSSVEEFEDIEETNLF